ncbi:acyltransferase family protein [Vreelandella titanicae]|uniref:acyltransferase family protein n=1 Tax=Vreelandella titanicae TaxID=664683 RepID=UPI00168083CA|nr:acyltransferase family protein [Halomonas titanicae]QNU61642.1 acyltransferase [Halomonas titanicae]
MNKTFEIYIGNNSYRNDIQGVRAIGAMLVLVFHIWFHKVSGGVDVFFVVSGFLMTGMLLRQYAREGKLNPLQFWGGIIKRVVPAAYVVLLITFFLSYFFIPPVYWRQTIHEFVFSAVQMENLLLIRREVDYLESETPASPFQQYWALSIQVQFYIFLPLFIKPLIHISNKIKSLAPMIVGISMLVSISLLYSIFHTSMAPDTAYFNPLGRAWEFLAGGLVAVLIPYIRLTKKFAFIISLLGIFILFSVGLALPKKLNFPGYVALLPVMAAIFLIIAGSVSEKNTVVSMLLSNKFLVMLGAMSFTVYLWHWPILVFFQHYYETTNLGFVKGMMVIVLGVLLAILTTLVIEKPFRRIPKARTWFAYMVGCVFCIPSVSLGLGAKYYLENLHDVEVVFKREFFDGNRITIQNGATNLDYNYVTAISSDLGAIMDKNSDCFTEMDEATIVSCEFGDTSSDNVVVIVGGSHAGQWEPFFSYLANEYGFKLISIVKQSCSLGYEIVEDNRSCKIWNENIIDYLAEINPDLVITNSSRSNRPRENRLVVGDPIEFVPAGHVEKWKEITALGIPVIGIRDNPWFESDPSYCVWKNSREASECARPVEEVLLQENPANEYQDEIPLFISIDFTKLICEDRVCPAFFDERLMWSDTHHLSRTYLKYITLSLKRSLEMQTTIFQTFSSRTNRN